MTSNYGYDAIYELTSVLQGANTTESYTYDPVGNRLSSLGVSPYSYNASNELTSTPNATYGYDLNGNAVTKNDSTGITTYAWDFENRLTGVTLPAGGGTVTFAYDPFGRRIEKASSAGTSIYAYDGDNLVEETNSSGAVVARYSQGLNIDEPLAMLRSGATDFYEADGLGSVTSLTSAAGALAQTYTFDSFGKQTASSGSLTNPFQYTGREFDPETSLYYYRARYYDPATGRFLSEDPIGFNPGQSNFYSYVGNSPLGRFDPSGLATCDYFIRGGPNGNGWLYCTPDDPRDSPVSFMGASGNNGDGSTSNHCKNNPDCAPFHETGPIPPGHYHFSGKPGSHHYNGTLLMPDDPLSTFGREKGKPFEIHWCPYPFGPSRKKPFCSEGCITASQDDIQKLNNLLTQEPGSTLTVYPGLPEM